MFKTRFGFTVLLLLLSHFSRVLRSADCQGPLSVGFSRQEYWSGLPCTPPGDLPDPGIEPGSRALQADSSPLSHQGSPVCCCSSLKRVRILWRATAQFVRVSKKVGQALNILLIFKSEGAVSRLSQITLEKVPRGHAKTPTARVNGRLCMKR